MDELDNIRQKLQANPDQAPDTLMPELDALVNRLEQNEVAKRRRRLNILTYAATAVAAAVFAAIIFMPSANVSPTSSAPSTPKMASASIEPEVSQPTPSVIAAEAQPLAMNTVESMQTNAKAVPRSKNRMVYATSAPIDVDEVTDTELANELTESALSRLNDMMQSADRRVQSGLGVIDNAIAKTNTTISKL